MKTNIEIENIVKKLENFNNPEPIFFESKRKKNSIKIIFVFILFSIFLIKLLDTKLFEIKFQNLFFPTIKKARENKTKMDLHLIKQFLNLYKAENGNYPEDFNKFLIVNFIIKSSKIKTPQDGWGNSYLLLKNNNSMYIKSAGNDCKYYTNDDIDEIL
ncbi:MAG: type II secretion system protein GspG [bacterium]